MGLDKWLNSEKVAKKEIKKPDESKGKRNEVQKGPDLKNKMMKIEKYTLNCPNSKCKYQKIVMKKKLTNKDKICPRCNKEMRVKSS